MASLHDQERLVLELLRLVLCVLFCCPSGSGQELLRRFFEAWDAGSGCIGVALEGAGDPLVCDAEEMRSVGFEEWLAQLKVVGMQALVGTWKRNSTDLRKQHSQCWSPLWGKIRQHR